MTSRTLPHQKFPRKSVLGAACALLVACSSGSEPRQQPDDDGIPELGDVRLQLERAASCDELLTRIQDSIIVQLAQRAEQLKQDLLRRPELAGLASEMWQGLRAFVEQDMRGSDSAIRRHMTATFVDIGRQLAWYHKAGMVTAPLQPTDLVDGSFLEEALRALPR